MKNVLENSDKKAVLNVTVYQPALISGRKK